MQIQELVNHWENASKGERTPQQFSIHLPLKEAAQVLALREMYPDCTEEQILTDLLCFALGELSQAFPYEAGQQVSQDEYGDPIYADAGLTPKFIRLAQKYRSSLETQRHNSQRHNNQALSNEPN
jgi:hypothetical protein